MGEENPDIPDLAPLYGQISRLYNSSISVFATILFGWIAFLGFILNLKWNDLPKNNLIVLMISGFLVFGCSALYFYIRILRLGRFVARIENDLELRVYINNLPRLTIFGYPVFRWFENASGRPNDDPERWSRVEILTSILVVAFFLITARILVVNVLS